MGVFQRKSYLLNLVKISLNFVKISRSDIMTRIRIKPGAISVLEKLVKDGYVISDGARTRQLVRELNSVNAPFAHGYYQKSKKIILALSGDIRIQKKRWGSTIIDLEF